MPLTKLIHFFSHRRDDWFMLDFGSKGDAYIIQGQRFFIVRRYYKAEWIKKK